MRFLLKGLLCVFIPFGVAVGDAESIVQLQRMNTAIQSLNYHGTIVYLHDGRMESLRLIHGNDGQNEYERVVHLTGVAREVLRENDTVRCYLSDSQSVMIVERQRLNRLISKVDTANSELANHYQLRLVEGIERVAGRNARILSIEPKDGFRYGYRLWLDEQTGLLLRSELYSAQGDVLEQFMFAQVDIVDNIPVEMLQPSAASLNKDWRDDVRPAAIVEPANTRWQVTVMPDGFNLLGHYNKQLPNSTDRAEHLVVGDGLASVSVYIESYQDKDQTVVGASQMGAVNMFGSVFGNHQLTVVGEVPAATVRMIADSVRYRLDN